MGWRSWRFHHSTTKLQAQSFSCIKSSQRAEMSILLIGDFIGHRGATIQKWEKDYSCKLQFDRGSSMKISQHTNISWNFPFHLLNEKRNWIGAAASLRAPLATRSRGHRDLDRAKMQDARSNGWSRPPPCRRTPFTHPRIYSRPERAMAYKRRPQIMHSGVRCAIWPSITSRRKYYYTIAIMHAAHRLAEANQSSSVMERAGCLCKWWGQPK